MSEENAPEQVQKKVLPKPGRKEGGIPAKVTTADCLKAIQVLSDKGGKGRSSDLEVLFGNSETLGRSLSALQRLGIIEKKGLEFSLGDTGKKFIVSDEKGRKKIFAEKVLAFQKYQDVFIRLRNNPEKSLKKEDLTDMWIKIVGQGGKVIRQQYTTTFADFATWSELVSDSGRTLTLIESLTSSPPLPSSLSPLLPQPPTTVPSPLVTPVNISPQKPYLNELSIQVESCPLCKSNEIGLKNEDIIQSFQTKTGYVVLLKHIYYCRNCQREFSRTVQQSIESATEEKESK